MSQHKLISTDSEWGTILSQVKDELFIAERKFPLWPDDVIHGAAIVSEEAGEMIQAAINHHYIHASPVTLRREVIQTAAMAIRFLIALGRAKE